MQIKYFSYIAEQSFKTLPDGRKLFFFFTGLWSKPYVIPDHETEKRLFNKHLWFVRLFFGSFIISQPLLFITFPNIATAAIKPIGFLLYFAVMLFLARFVIWLIFRKDIQVLKPATDYIPFSNFSYFYRETAKHHSILGIMLGVLLCSGFIWVGYSMSTSPSSAFIGWVCMLFSAVSGILWSYLLFLKLMMWKDKGKDVVSNKTEA